jgi:hypothetical protein
VIISRVSFGSPDGFQIIKRNGPTGLPLCRKRAFVGFVQCGEYRRRFRVAADGSLHVTDPNALEVEWLTSA